MQGCSDMPLQHSFLFLHNIMGRSGLDYRLTDEEKALRYEPAPSIPKWFLKEMKALVPLNPHGEPFLRFVWGMDRTDWFDGVELPRYQDTFYDPPKYRGREAWILEGWQPPDVFDRAEWEAQKDLLGDFPTKGVWDHLAIHANPDGSYRPLEQGAIDLVRSWAYWRGMPRQRSIQFLIDQKRQRKAYNEAAKRARLENTIGEALIAFRRLFETEVEKAFSLPKSNADGTATTASGLIVPASAIS